MTKNQTIGSGLVAALESLWTDIRRTHPELPEHVMFVTGSGRQGFGSKWAHFDRNGWLVRGKHSGCDEECDKIHVDGNVPEIFVSGERFQAGAEFVVQSVLHEAAHALAAMRDIQDTSRGNRYHNKRFVALAVELGLEYAKDAPHRTLGFSEVTITDETKKRYARSIRCIERAVDVFRPEPDGDIDLGALLGMLGGMLGPTARKTKVGSKSLPKAQCQCDEPRIIRIARSVFDIAPITCGECGEDFEIVE